MIPIPNFNLPNTEETTLREGREDLRDTAFNPTPSDRTTQVARMLFNEGLSIPKTSKPLLITENQDRDTSESDPESIMD